MRTSESSLTGSLLVFLITALFFDPCGGNGFTPEGKSIISPVLPLGRGGGGCRLGSVGLSDEDVADVAEVFTVGAGLLVGGGVIGLGIRLAEDGGLGDGEGGRGRALREGLAGGDTNFEEVVFVRERGTENERDLKIILKMRINEARCHPLVKKEAQ